MRVLKSCHGYEKYKYRRKKKRTVCLLVLQQLPSPTCYYNALTNQRGYAWLLPCYSRERNPDLATRPTRIADRELNCSQRRERDVEFPKQKRDRRSLKNKKQEKPSHVRSRTAIQLVISSKGDCGSGSVLVAALHLSIPPPLLNKRGKGENSVNVIYSTR